MPIFICGLNHKTAPVALRERVMFAVEKLPVYLHDLAEQENISEAVLLSTCNRSELYCETQYPEQAVAWFCRQHGVAEAELQPALYCYHEKRAVEHLMEVACGLDSLVLGEPQILGQLKTAFSESCAAGSVGPLFNRLFQHVFSVAKAVRSNTAIGACPVSISSSTVNFIKHVFPGNLAEANVLLLGAGDTIHLVLRYLNEVKLGRVVIANRSLDNAKTLAEKYHARCITFDALPHALDEADIIISATGSPLPLITRAMLQQREKPLYIMDIAVPRDVEASVAELDCVKLYSIDDLKLLIQQNFQSREHAARKARDMIQEKSSSFMAWLNSLDKVAHTIRAYREQIETICHIELVKARQQLQQGTDPAEVLDYFAKAFTNKLLHHPSVQLRQAGVEGRFDILEFARQLFAIPETKPELL